VDVSAVVSAENGQDLLAVLVMTDTGLGFLIVERSSIRELEMEFNR
jgi:hypothetical protein